MHRTNDEGQPAPVRRVQIGSDESEWLQTMFGFQQPFDFPEAGFLLVALVRGKTGFREHPGRQISVNRRHAIDLPAPRHQQPADVG